MFQRLNRGIIYFTYKMMIDAVCTSAVKIYSKCHLKESRVALNVK